MDEVILVTPDDREISVEEKLEAHKKGHLHRAVSVLLFDSKGNWLLQKRATSKYHSPGKWANSCCSHPKPFEKTLDAAERRLYEELGIRCPLKFHSSFIYKADVGNGLIEHEFDHLFIGHYEGIPSWNKDEVSLAAWWSLDEIKKKYQEDPSLFAAWFPYILERAPGEIV